jgi:hypothetical protein
MKVQTLKSEIKELQAKIEKIQSECSHPESARKETRGSDTGNWCPQDNSYWIDVECGLCEKRWREDQ